MKSKIANHKSITFELLDTFSNLAKTAIDVFHLNISDEITNNKVLSNCRDLLIDAVKSLDALNFFFARLQLLHELELEEQAKDED